MSSQAQKIVFWICLILVVIGALNWGLVGAAEYDLIDGLFGKTSVLARLVYILVAVSAIALVILIPAAKMIQ